jgi:transcription initiation factor TFIIB
LQNAAARVAVKSGDRSLGVAYGEITTLCEKLGMTRQLQDTAKQLFRRQDEEKICRGKARDAIVAACIFLAARITGAPRTFKEIVDLTQVDKRKLAACYQLLKTAFDATASIDQSRDSSGLQSSASAVHQVGRFTNHLGLPAWVASVSKNVCAKVMELGKLDGRSPITVAGTSIYFATHLLGVPKTAAECASVAGIAPGTLQHAYRCVHTASLPL